MQPEQPELRLREAQRDDAPVLADLYARTFDDNAAYASIFQLRETDAEARCCCVARRRTRPQLFALTPPASATRPRSPGCLKNA